MFYDARNKCNAKEARKDLKTMNISQIEMTWTNIALIVGFVLIFVMAIAMLVQWIMTMNKRRNIGKMVFRGIFFATIIAGYVFLFLTQWNDKTNLIPFNAWRRISELGHVAVSIEILKKGIPFFVMGIFLPLSYRTINRIDKAMLTSLAFVLPLGLLQYLILKHFNIDDLIYGWIFAIAGFSFTSLLAWIFTKSKLLGRIRFSKVTHIIGVFWLMLVYFSFMAIMLLNNSLQLGSLKLPVMTQSLPQNTQSMISLSDERRSVAIMKMVQPNVVADATTLAKIFGMKNNIDASVEEQKQAQKEEMERWAQETEQAANQAQAEGDAETAKSLKKDAEASKEAAKKVQLQNLALQEGDKTLNVNESGEWRFQDREVAQREGSITEEKAIENAKTLVSQGIAPGYSVQNAEVYSTEKNADGTLKSVQVYITGQYNGLEVIGSCEIFITVGSNGAIIEVEKYDPNFENAKTKKIISSRKAYEYFQMYQQGQTLPNKISVSHNLYQPATLVTLNTAKMAYWFDETAKTLQPIWVFNGTANMEDGTQKNVSVYVSAIE